MTPKTTRALGILIFIPTCLGGAVAGELLPDSITPYASLGTLYDTNIFRLDDAFDSEDELDADGTSDLVRVATTGLAVNLPVSRQRFRVEGEASRVEYGRFDALNHTAWNAGLIWDWAVGSRWSGRFSEKFDRRLVDFTEFRSPELDMVEVRSRELGGEWAMTPRWILVASYRKRLVEHSLEGREGSEFRSDATGLGVDYRSRAGNRLGIRAQQEDGENPRRVTVPFAFTDKAYRQRRTVLRVERFMRRSRVAAEIGYASRNYDTLAARDFSGVVGDLDFDWQLSGKTLLRFGAARELHALDDPFSSSVVISEGNMQVLWRPTHKILVQPHVRYQHREFQDDLNFFPALTREAPREHIWGLGMSVNYELSRWFQVGLGYEKGWRNSSRFGYDYDYNAWTVTLKGNL